MSYEIYTVIPGDYNEKEKIKNVVNINWSDDLDNIFTSFSFTTSEILEVGTWIKLKEKYDNKTVLIGIITKTSQSQKGLYTYNGFDVNYALSHY